MEEILTQGEANQIANELIAEMGKEGAQLNDGMVQIILSSIASYENQVAIVESQLDNLISKDSRKSALQKMKDAKKAQKNYNKHYGKIDVNNLSEVQKSEMQAAQEKVQNAIDQYQLAKDEIKQQAQSEQLQHQVIDLYTAGYKMIMNIRKLYAGKDIQYHVAVEGASSSLIYAIDEETLLKNLDFDLDRFAKLLITNANAKNSAFDATMRYRATKQRGQEANSLKKNDTDPFGILQDNLLNVTNGSSTLWSLGYKVFSITKAWYSDKSGVIRSAGISSKGFGVNFGHFLEAYYHFGGHKANRTYPLPSAEEFLITMLSLQNSQKFYQGGDYEDIQLKSNTATLTSLKTIRYALRDIRVALSKTNREYQKNLENVFEPKKSEIANAVKSSKVPQEALNDLLKQINGS